MLRSLTVSAVFLFLTPCYCVVAKNNASTEADDAWIAFVAEHKELYEVVHPFAKKLGSNLMTLSQYRKWLRLIENRSKAEARIMERLTNHIRERYRFDDPIYDKIPIDMEEVKVLGRMFDLFPLDPAEFSYGDILGMRGIRKTANELYKEGKYDDAYPLLLDLAKRGFKDSQTRLAYILLSGTETVKKSNLRALGWLGTAAFGESEPMFRVLFKRYMAQVPSEYRPTVDRVLDGYRKQFDSSAYVDCTTNHRFSRGIVKRTYCQFDLEAKVEACMGLRCSAHKINARDDSFSFQ